MGLVKKNIKNLRPEKFKKKSNLLNYLENRNKILIIRSVGGLGDIFMHRMMFEDFKNLSQDLEVHFCCPSYYHDAIKDHPFVDKILDCQQVNKNDYVIYYNTSTVCGRTEMDSLPNKSPHRSDIWANHCGVELKNHDMHINLSDWEKNIAYDLLKSINKTSVKSVAICPISAMINKNLLPNQVCFLVDFLKKQNLFPFCLHHKIIEYCEKNKIPSIIEPRIRIWMAVLQQVDYVISVDTAAFHCAGGLKKPLTGIFSFIDGKVYGKYFDFVLLQKHKENDANWTCGPCYDWCKCPKTSRSPKPCITDISEEMLTGAVNRMLEKWPL